MSPLYLDFFLQGPNGEGLVARGICLFCFPFCKPKCSGAKSAMGLPHLGWSGGMEGGKVLRFALLTS